MNDDELRTLAEAVVAEWQLGEFTTLKRLVAEDGPLPDPNILICPLCGIDRAVAACPSHYPTTCPFMGRN